MKLERNDKKKGDEEQDRKRNTLISKEIGEIKNKLTKRTSGELLNEPSVADTRQTVLDVPFFLPLVC
jgi:hypothetical protein